MDVIRIVAGAMPLADTESGAQGIGLPCITAVRELTIIHKPVFEVVAEPRVVEPPVFDFFNLLSLTAVKNPAVESQTSLAVKVLHPIEI